MIALPLAALLAVAAPATCTDLPATSTIADQFTCYKNAGTKVVVPGTAFIGGFDGPGCITGVWADRIQVTTCGPSTLNRRSVMVMFSSVRAVEEGSNTSYVTLRLNVEYGQVDCSVVQCVNYVYAPAPAPAPAPADRRIATPPRTKP